jgi:hypothetical protein
LQSIISVARHLAAGAAVKQMTKPALASAAGQMRRQECRALRPFMPPKTLFTIKTLFIMMAASSSPQPAGCGTLAFATPPSRRFVPKI